MKSCEFIGSSKDELSVLPADVKEVFGYAIYLAQAGGKHPDAKPLKGFGGAGVLEVVANDDGNTYRAVYTVKFEEAVYVLTAFQKKSKSSAATPQHIIKLIEKRLKTAQERHNEATRKKKAG